MKHVHFLLIYIIKCYDFPIRINSVWLLEIWDGVMMFISCVGTGLNQDLVLLLSVYLIFLDWKIAKILKRLVCCDDDYYFKFLKNGGKSRMS